MLPNRFIGHTHKISGAYANKIVLILSPAWAAYTSGKTLSMLKWF